MMTLSAIAASAIAPPLPIAALVVIDARVEAIATLRSHLKTNLDPLTIEATDDGLAQVQARLERNPQLRELHLISHARPGAIELGATGITLDAIAAQSHRLSAIGSRLNRLVIYGCQAAAGDAGVELVETLAQVMGCTIIASSTNTGDRDRGGDWNLDVVRGAVRETTAAPTGDADCAPAVIFQPSIVTYPGLLVNDSYTASDEDTVFTVDAASGVLSNDTGSPSPTSVINIEDASGSFVGVSSGSSGTATTSQGGSVTVNSDGSLSYTPPTNKKVTFTDTFDYINNVPNRFTVTFSVTGLNDTPTASAIAFTVPEDNTSTVLGSESAFDLAFADNDTGDTLQSIRIKTLPSSGTLEDSDGPVVVNDVILRANIDTLRFKPVTNSTASQSFTFTVFDNSSAESSAATATLNITGSPDRPVAVDDTATTRPNTSVTIAVTANDSDPDGERFEIFASGSDSTSAKGGSISFSTQSLTYSPPAGFVGTDTFTYAISDSISNDTAVVTVTVNTNPVATDDFATATNGVATDIFLLANDTDANGSNDSISLDSSLPLVTDKGGEVTLADRSTQSYTYTAASGFTGADRVEYTIADSFGGTASAFLNINVADAVNDVFQIPPNTSVSMDLLANDSQFEALSFVSFDTVGRNDGIVSVKSGNILLYTPPTNYTGEDYIFYTATDSLGNQDTALVTIQINSLFPDPNADPDAEPTIPLTGFEGSTIAIAALPPGQTNATTSTVAVNRSEGGTAFGDASNNSVVGLDGKDVLVGFEGGDNLIGGNGDDQLFANAGTDYLDGGAGNDILFGGKDNDYMLGNAGDDILAGEDEDDILSGGDGNDFLFGNRGRDRIDGGSGNDSIFGGRDEDTLTGSFGEDIISGERGNDTIRGGNENDQLFGNTENDLLDGSSGDDILYGGQNDDILYGGSGDDTLNGDRDNDALDGGDGNDTLNGGIGNDTLTGGIGDDVLTGGDGNDALNGGDGNDTLTGGIDDDVLTGGDGVDRFTVDNDGSVDTITDFVPGTDELFFPTLTRDSISVIDDGSGNTLVQEFTATTNITLASLSGISASSITVNDLAF